MSGPRENTAVVYALGRLSHAEAAAAELRAGHKGARVVLAVPDGPAPSVPWADETAAASGLRNLLKGRRPAAFALVVTNEPEYLSPGGVLRALRLMAMTRPRERRVWLYGWSGRYTVGEKIGDAARVGLGLALRPFYLLGLRAVSAVGELVLPAINGRARNAPYAPENVKRVLLMSLDLVGDLVWTGPAVRSAKASFPDVRVDMLVAARNAGLARRLPGVDGVIAYDAPWLRKIHNPAGGPGWRPSRLRNLATRLRLAMNGYDLVADFRGEARHAVLGYFTGAPYVASLGARAAGPIRPSDIGYLMTHRLNDDALKEAGTIHTLDRNMALVRTLGFAGGDASPWLRPEPEDEARVRRLLEGGGAGGQGSLVCIQPGASRAEKRWSLDGFAEVARALIERYGARVVIAGSPDERPLGGYIAERAPGAVDICGETSLGEFVALVASSDLVVSNDTSAISIASATGTPVVCLVAVATEVMGPYGVPSVVLQKKPDCYDPVAEHCFCPYGYRCLQEITPAEVVAAADGLLTGRTQPKENR